MTNRLEIAELKSIRRMLWTSYNNAIDRGDTWAADGLLWCLNEATDILDAIE